jgi:hypothetical protein
LFSIALKYGLGWNGREIMQFATENPFQLSHRRPQVEAFGVDPENARHNGKTPRETRQDTIQILAFHKAAIQRPGIRRTTDMNHIPVIRTLRLSKAAP